MIIRFQQSAVAKLLRTLAGFTTKPPDPLCHLLIRAKSHETVVVANNPNSQAWAKLDCICEEGGEVLVRADMLVALLDRLPDAELVLKTGKAVSVHCGKNSYRLSSILDTAYFPQAQPTPEPATMIQAGRFVGLVDAVAHAAGVNDVRFYLNGVMFRQANGRLEAVATDGHRLARGYEELSGELPEVIVPIAAIQKLRGALSEEGMVKFLSRENRYFIEDGAGLHVNGSVYDHKFPDVDRVIPAESSLSFKAYADALLAGVQRACIVHDPGDGTVQRKFPWIRLTQDGVKLRLSNEGKSSGMEEILTVAAPSPSRKGEATVNAEYLQDALGAMKGEASFFVPERGDQPLKIEQPDRTSIIMQMRV